MVFFFRRSLGVFYSLSLGSVGAPTVFRVGVFCRSIMGGLLPDFHSLFVFGGAGLGRLFFVLGILVRLLSPPLYYKWSWLLCPLTFEPANLEWAPSEPDDEPLVLAIRGGFFF